MDLSAYLPLQYTTKADSDYCSFLQESAHEFYENNNYHFSYLALHLLFMYCIYTKVWQLSKIDLGRVVDALSLSHYDEKDGRPHGETLTDIIRDAKSPTMFRIFKVEERSFVKILNLFNCSNLSGFKKAVNLRNKLAHVNETLPMVKDEFYNEKVNELSVLLEQLNNLSSPYLLEHAKATLKEIKRSRPYSEEEINRDLEIYLVSGLMLSPRDCALVSQGFTKKRAKIYEIAAKHFAKMGDQM